MISIQRVDLCCNERHRWIVMPINPDPKLSETRVSPQRIRGRHEVQRFVASLPQSSTDRLLAVFLNDRFDVVQHEIIDGGKELNTENGLRQVIFRGLEHQPTVLILAHHVSKPDAHANVADIGTAKRLGFLARQSGLQVIDHLIVTSDAVFSIRGSKL